MPSHVKNILVVVLLGIALLSLWNLRVDGRGITRESIRVGETPATVYRGDVPGPAPVVLVAHGFAGSQRLMEPFALALAGRGYVVVTFDFLGHGRHPRPMRGSLMEQDGAAVLLLEQTAEVAEAALELPGTDGRLALVGHSMATNILVRHAQKNPRVMATVGVSTFAPTIDASTPPNLLLIVGALEGRLKEEGRRLVSLSAGIQPDSVSPFVTYGAHATGTARRLAVAPRVEHVGVLYSPTTLDETHSWLDATFNRNSVDFLPGRAERRGLWILLLMAAVFFLARPMAALLPTIVDPPGGANAPWPRLLLVAGIPALATPLVLRPIPTGFLPVVVGDYLAVHFFTFGALTAMLLWWTGERPGINKVLEDAGLKGPGSLRVVIGAAGIVLFFLVLIALPLDRFFSSFFPAPERLPLMLAVLAGTLPYFLADEWLTRGTEARRGAYALTKALFLVSLGLAVALDAQSLFFLLIIFPVILAFFFVHGLFSRWTFRSTGSPVVAGLGNAVAFAWAMGVTFPMYAGV